MSKRINSEYESDFPSNALLRKYFGRNRKLTVRLDVGNVARSSHSILRQKFDDALRVVPELILKRMDQASEGFVPIKVFDNGACHEVARFWLSDIGIDLTPEMESALCDEFIAHYQRAPFRHGTWWEWFVEERTIGARITADANPQGGNRPRRTLKEVLYGNTE